ncbi:MAG: hypothetical protein K1X74_12560 [Pirellulales bacterium]|nr:hypothetical protein [Pirellulales bacterium]
MRADKAFFPAIAWLLLGWLAAAPARGESPSFAQWLPPTVSWYVETGREPFELRTDDGLPGWFERFASVPRRLDAVAWDDEHGALAARLNCQPGDEQELSAAQSADREVRGFTPLYWSRQGDWLVISSSRGLLDEILDRRSDPNRAPLAADRQFAAAWTQLPAEQTRRMFLRLDRTSHRAARSWSRATRLVCRGLDLAPDQRAFAEVALANFGATLEENTYLAVSSRPQVQPREATIVTPAAAKEARLFWEFVAALPNRGPTFAPLLPESTILSLSTFVDRELAALTAQTLLDPERLARLGENSPELRVLLEALSFSVQTLDQIEPSVQVVLARQEFPDAVRRPSFPLPGLAAVVVPRDPERIKPAFVLAFVTAVRQANEVATNAGRPRYVMRNRRIGSAMITAGIYPQAAIADGISPNLTPTIATVGPRFIVSTSEELAEQLVRAALAEPTPRALQQSARLDFGPAAAARLGWEQLQAGVAGMSQRGSSLLAPLTDRLRGAVQATSRLGDDLAARLPKTTWEIPLPDFRGRYRLHVLTSDAPSADRVSRN